MPDNAALERLRRRPRPTVEKRSDSLIEQPPATIAPAPTTLPVTAPPADSDLVETAERRQFRLEVSIDEALDELIRQQPKAQRITPETLFEEMFVTIQSDPALLQKVLKGAAERRKKRLRSGRKRRIQKEMGEID